MPTNPEAVNQALGEFRAYLKTLTLIQIDPRLQSKFSMSDIVQQTLVEAWRDLERLQALDAAADESSCRLQSWLAAEDSSPSGRLAEQERDLRLLEALAKLDARQREALVLKQYHHWTLAQIAEHLGCTIGAVAGLQARGLKELRRHLPDME